MKKLLSCVLCFCILLVCVPLITAEAADDVYPYEVYCSNNNPAIGSTITIRVSLTDYVNAEKKIRGVQIDFTNIDRSVFEVVDHHTLIEETNVASNMTSYSEANSRVRLVYAKADGTLGDDVSDLMEFQLKINDTVTEEGTISIPITLKIQTTDVGAPGRITQNTTLDINYRLSNGIFSADIEWGSMEFEYSDGIWNPSTHKYENGGWTCADGANTVKVSNYGDMDITAKYSYLSDDEYSAITGSFKDEDSNEITSKNIISGESSSVYLELFGSLKKDIESQKLGSIKVILNEVTQ